MEETKKMEQPEKKMIKVTVDGCDGHMEYEGTAIVVLVMNESDDGKSIYTGGKTEGWFSDDCLMAMQEVLESNFPNWNKTNVIRLTGHLMKKMLGNDEDEEEDAEAPESDPEE